MILHASIVDIPLFGYKYDIYSEDDEPRLRASFDVK
jgi:hypothetical protein